MVTKIAKRPVVVGMEKAINVTAENVKWSGILNTVKTTLRTPHASEVRGDINGI